MKKELNFYEFVGLIIPSVILLFSVNFIISRHGLKPFFDFSNVSESVIFLIFCYGLGHIIQGTGNILENWFWKIYGGMPTKWLLTNNRFKQSIVDNVVKNKVIEKLTIEYTNVDNSIDYGLTLYNKLSQKQLTARIDIFNGNYSLFRGLNVVFISLGIYLLYLKEWILVSVCFFCLFICIRRMVRFAKHYAKEIYRCYANMV